MNQLQIQGQPLFRFQPNPGQVRIQEAPIQPGQVQIPDAPIQPNLGQEQIQEDSHQVQIQEAAK